VNSFFDTLPFCGKIDISHLKQFQKVVIAKYEIDISGVITKKNVTLAYNQPPNRFLERGDLRIVGKDDSGNNVTGFLMNHPLDYDLPNHTDFEQGRMFGNKTEFYVVLPLEQDMTIVEVVNTTDNKTLITTNISREVKDFCAGKNEPGCPDYIGVNASADEKDLTDATTPEYDWGEPCWAFEFIIVPVSLLIFFYWRRDN
jgi:hypothetical protein